MDLRCPFTSVIPVSVIIVILLRETLGILCTNTPASGCPLSVCDIGRICPGTCALICLRSGSPRPRSSGVYRTYQLQLALVAFQQLQLSQRSSGSGEVQGLCRLATIKGIFIISSVISSCRNSLILANSDSVIIFSSFIFSGLPAGVRNACVAAFRNVVVKIVIVRPLYGLHTNDR